MPIAVGFFFAPRSLPAHLLHSIVLALQILVHFSSLSFPLLLHTAAYDHVTCLYRSSPPPLPRQIQ